MQYDFQNTALSFSERVKDLLQQLTIEEKLGLLSTHQLPIPRLNIGEWYVGQEIARGFVGRKEGEESTVFPQPIGLASTFDPMLMQQLGDIAGRETRYFHREHGKNGHLMVWGPTVDPERDPRWGRTEEGYGEDPFLISEMTTAYTLGLRGDHPKYRRVIPTLKHFCANNNEHQRINCSSNVSPRTLHEYYYRAFEGSVVRGGAESMMTCYNELAGVPGCMNPDLKTLTKEQWGLKFLVTDGADFSQNVLGHRSHPTHAEALAACLKNGSDIMTDDESMVRAAAQKALEQKLITEADIDRAIGNCLYERFRLGEFDGNACPYNTEEVDHDEFFSRMINHEATKEQICLLKNHNHFLPLADKPMKIAVIGPIGDENYRDWYTGRFSYSTSVKQAFEARFGAENVLFHNGYDKTAIRSCKNGKYFSTEEDGTLRAKSDTIGEAETYELHDWDFGSMNFKSCKNNLYVMEQDTYKAVSPTPYEWFIREWFRPTKYGEQYSFRSWHDIPHDIIQQEDDTLCCRPHQRTKTDGMFQLEIVENSCTSAAKLAKEADVVILCVGNHPMQVARECYDRPNLELPAHQKKLIETVTEANPNTVLAIISSYPFALNELEQKVPAIIYSTHAGAELGSALAEAICGDFSPAARCPITWYNSDSDLPDIMEYDIIEANRTYLYDDGAVLYPFGHGLSYGSFTYKNLTCQPVEEGYLFHFTLTNTSEFDSDEIPQLYFHPLHPRVKRPIRQLCGFRRLFIAAHETQEIELFVPHYALEFYDVTQEKMIVEQGTYCFELGASSRDIRLSITTEVIGETIPPRNFSKCTLAKNYDKKEGMDTHMWFSMHKNDWYMITNDWGGTLIYDDVAFENYSKAVIEAAAPCAPAKLILKTGETVLGETEVTPSNAKDDFQTYTISLQPYTATAPLTLEIKGMASVYSIQFYR